MGGGLRERNKTQRRRRVATPWEIVDGRGENSRANRHSAAACPILAARPHRFTGRRRGALFESRRLGRAKIAFQRGSMLGNQPTRRIIDRRRVRRPEHQLN
ncbi:MAG TPA: hypothetical protein DEP35_11285 [Deltaproteobacteria bacterium]|nr:hypothetical protein [Deltaproteobacteria bacterium]